MFFNRTAVVLSAICLNFTAAAACKSPIDLDIKHNNFNSTLWYQTSAEFRANSIQTFQTATALLATAKQDLNWSALQQTSAQKLPPAIIVDIDETILDNSPSAAHEILKQSGYNEAGWDHWVSLAAADAIPGAVQFVNKAQAAGIKILFISNRACTVRPGNTATCPQKLDTLKNLQQVGINQVNANQIWLKKEQTDWTSEKASRRVLASQQYRILMLVGDDLGDFLDNVKGTITPQQRAKLVDQHSANWGTKWFMLSNPTYGSWETILQAPKASYLRPY